jgi:lipopolysaccharide/colanic/teichoic acid biosynthesis glycosyltransferase
MALILLAPLLLLLALVVWINLGRPVLFRQIRAGRHGVPFTLLKFRTMTDGRVAQGELLPDHDRLKRCGKILRATSLDELPQLWNVLRGEMSLVGPRPLLPQYVDRYSARQARRLEVQPGLTGWAQVCGRNALSWEDRFELDVWYVEHRTLWLDLRILVMTIWKTLRREGISAAGHVTMPEFRGSAETGMAA